MLDLPTVENILEIHEYIISKRGEPGVFPEGKGRLASFLERIEYNELEEELKSIVEIVTYLYEFITRMHCFIDGNKRTAIATVMETCLMNGYALRKLDKDTEVQFALKIASTDIEEVGIDEIKAYFNERIILFKRHFEKRVIDSIYICPQCKNQLQVSNRICICGLKLSGVVVENHGILQDYQFRYGEKELDRLAKKHRHLIKKS